jgi:SAM-dependent methyltransferase
VRRVLRGGGHSADDLRHYWSDPPDADNAPETYLSEQALPRSAFLVGLVQEIAPPDARILEVGCNVGRNLNALRQAGYGDLTGIEINSAALDILRERQPELAAVATLRNESVEDAARTFRDGEFDVIYTVAVLEHIHTSSEWVFAEMARAARRGVITMEDERTTTWKHFPRNYRDAFEAVGLKQVKEVPLGPEQALDEGFVARVFAPPASS